MLKKVLRSLSTFLVLVMLINMLPLNAWAVGNVCDTTLEFSADDNVVTENVLSELSATDISTAKIIREAVDRRTEYSKAFQLDDGTYVAAVYAQPIHYKVNGQWEDIDNTLQINTDGTFSNKAGMWNVQLPQQLSGSDAVTVVKDGYTLSFRMAGELLQSGNLEIMNISQTEPLTASVENFSIASQIYSVSAAQAAPGQIQTIDISVAYNEAQYKEFVAEKNASRLLYANVYEGTNVQYDLKGNQLKESIILDAYRNTLRGYRYILNVGEMIPVLQEDNSIYFYDADGEDVVMVMPAPYLVDNAGVYNYDIQVNLTGTGSTYTLTYLLPQQWLAQESRMWPVILDPVVQPQIDAINIRDHSVASNGSYVTYRYVLECGYGPSNHIHRIYLKYRDLPTLPEDAVIASANIQMYKLNNTSNTSGTMEVHKVLSDWETETLTWANKPDYDPAIENAVVVGNDSRYYTWDVTSIVQGWYANTNTGMMFKMDNFTEAAGGNSWKQFYASDYGVTAYMPTLTIAYYLQSTITLGYSAEVNITGEEDKQIFKFTPTITGTYIIQSSNPTGDPKVSMFDIFAGKTLQDDDSAGNLNFRLSVYLHANYTYRIVAGHDGTNTGSYRLTILKPAEIINGFYQLSNLAYGNRVEIHGPNEQIYVNLNQNAYEEDETWLIQKQADGYYTIRSQFGNHYYIGINNTNTGENNVRLFSLISDLTKWNIYVTSTGTYIFEPKTALGKAMYAPSFSSDTILQLAWMGERQNCHKWYVNQFLYNGPTFSAFDVGNSSADEVSIIKEQLEKLGYTNIGAYKNDDGYISGQLVKDIARYSDIVYINSHGGLFSNLRVQVAGAATANYVENICAEDSVEIGDGKNKVGIGAEWTDDTHTVTDSFWNFGTKWVILSQCDQLNHTGDRSEVSWNGLSSAQVWAGTMLGEGERIHGILGYHNGAPPEAEHTDRLEAFFEYAESMSIIDAWKKAHPTGLFVADTNWAVMYHAANANDSLTGFTASTASGSAYTIYLERSESSNYLFRPSTTTSASSSTLSLNSNLFPVFEEIDTNAVYNTYISLQNDLLIDENMQLLIDKQNRIIYNNFNTHTGEANLGLVLSDQQAVTVALRQLEDLGLAPDGDYKATVSYVLRYEIDLDSTVPSEPETIEYTVCFYRTHNGMDVLSDQNDGIVVSFNKYGLTNLQYKWRDIRLVEHMEIMSACTVTAEQAEGIYLTAVGEAFRSNTASTGFESTDEPIVTAAYLEIDGEMRSVWVCSPDGDYSDHIFIDTQTGERVIIG